MARLQYQPATKPRGFQPIQLSRAGIARMEEEGNRVIRNLEQERDATIRQRQEDLQAMKENAAYERQAAEKNQKIIETNLENERLSIEAEQKAKRQQADAKAKSIESTVTGLVNFSVTLGKQAAEKTKKMIEDQIAEGAQASRQAYLDNPEQKNNYAVVERQLDVTIEKYDQAEFISGQAGFTSSFEASRNLVANPGRGYYWKKGFYNEQIRQHYPTMVDRVLQSTEEIFVDKNGNKFSGIQAVNDPDKMRIVLGKVQDRLYGASGLDVNSLEPGFLEPSSEFVAKFVTTKIRQASNKATDKNYTILAERGEDLRSQGKPAAAFWLDSKNPKLGRQGALKNFFGLYSAKNADGSFRYSVEELDAQIITPDGQAVSEKWGNSQRYQDAIAARVRINRESRSAERANTRLEAAEFADRAVPQMQEYFENADAQGDLQGAATFEKEFYKRFPNQTLPSGYVRAKKAALKENYDAEVAAIQARAKTQTLDKEFVDAIENPKLQLAAIKAFKEQETAKYGPKYGVMQKSLVSEAKTLTKFDPTVEGPGSGTTIMVTNALKNEYKYFFKTLVDKGVPIDAAADQAYAQLTDYIAKGKTDKTNKFYTETGALNKPTFPNIQGATQAISASSQEQRNELNKLILQNNANVGGVFSIPNAVLSETQIETTVNSYYADNGTFKIPVDIQYAAKLAGVNPIAAINEQIQASNEKYGTNRRLITPSPAEEAIFDQVPSVQKLFTDSEKMSQTRFSRGTAHLTGTARPVRASMTGTGVAPIQQTNALVEVAGELGVNPIDLATIIGFETAGTYDPGIVGGEGGNYQGLIQFGGPERAAYGVVPGMSFEEQLRGPVKKFFQDRFKSVGMSTQGASLEDLYTTVLAGNPKANRNARDSFGTSARSGVAKMGPHRERAMQRFGFSQN